MQLKKLHSKFDKLQKLFGHSPLRSVYGAGCIKNPKTMFIFMNPTAKNISARVSWRGLRAPWLGTKMVWQMFYKLGLISGGTFQKTQSLKPSEWSPVFAEEIYKELRDNRVYVTNLAKCTQADARSLKNSVFKNYLGLLLREIALLRPQNIITFGNQVSSIILGKQVSVSIYKGTQKEVLRVGRRKFNVYPTYYPVGQGRRNMPLAIRRIRRAVR